MENITISVPPYIAGAFEKADPSVKRKAEVYINAWLNDFFSNKSANEHTVFADRNLRNIYPSKYESLL